jgi:DNA-binding protein H-NS
MEKMGLTPDQVIEKIDADIEKRKNELHKYWEEVERANMALQQAKLETAAARKKELDKKQKQPPAPPPVAPPVQPPAKQTWTTPGVLG